MAILIKGSAEKQMPNRLMKILGPIPEIKESTLINDWENINVNWEESERSKC